MDERGSHSGVPKPTALHESEDRLRLFVAATNSVVYRMNADWTRMEHLVGNEVLADTPEPIEDWPDKYILPQDQLRVLEAIQHAISKKSVFELEHRVNLAGGSVGWMHSRAMPLLNDQGEITAWFGTGTDITERRRIESELQESEEKYRTIFERIDEGFCIYELIYDENDQVADLKWVEVNPAYEKQTGLSNVVGKLLSEVAPGTEKSWFDFYDEVAKTGKAVHFEDWHEPTGRWYNTFSSRIGGAGSRQVAVLFSDITERKQREAPQAFLLKLSDALRNVSKADLIADLAVKLLANELHLNRCYIVARRPEDDLWDVGAEFRAPSLPPMPSPLDQRNFPGSLRIITEETLVFNNTNHLPGLTEMEKKGLQALGFGAIVMGVLRKGEKNPSWAMVAASVEPRQWTNSEVALVQEVGERIWGTVERAQSEEALKRSEGKYRTLFETIDEGYCLIEVILDEKGNPVDELFLEMNPAYERHTGLTKEILGKRTSEIIPGREPEWLRFFGNVALTGRAGHIEYHVDAIGRWLSAHASRVGGSDSLRVAVVFNDITERKRHEQRQDYLLKLSDALRSVTDPIDIQETAAVLIGKHLAVNRAFYYEVASTDDGYVHIINKDYFLHDAASLAGTYARKTPENDLFRPLYDGVTLVVNDIDKIELLPADELAAHHAARIQSYITVPFLRQGHYVGGLNVQSAVPRVWTKDDISIAEETAQRAWVAIERAKAEEALREREAQLKQLLKMRDEFIGIASHELKTPVTSMKAYAEVVRECMEATGDADNSDLLSKLNVQIDRLTALINSLLDTTKMSEGQLKLDLEPLDLNELITERINEIKRISSHRFELRLQDAPPITADRERIGQVITNLLSNAIKYSLKGTPITVTSVAEHDAVRVSVQDEGFGIPEQDLEKIFERYFRVMANNMDTFPGMGLGLYITAQIVQKHGGVIGVQSKQGQGSIFSFTLPYNNHTS